MKGRGERSATKCASKQACRRATAWQSGVLVWISFLDKLGSEGVHSYAKLARAGSLQKVLRWLRACVCQIEICLHIGFEEKVLGARSSGEKQLRRFGLLW